MTQRVLSFHYVLTSKEGQTIDSSRDGNPLAILEGTKQIIPGLEEEIAKMQVGDKQDVFVPADKAYGQYNEALKMDVKRSQLPEGDIRVGVRFRGGQDANSPIFTVIKIEGEDITLDGNHPLAGQDLNFAVEMMEIREPTEQELEKGHVCGGCGHDHEHDHDHSH